MSILRPALRVSAALVLVATITACGGGDENAAPADSPTTAAAGSATTATAPASTAAPSSTAGAAVKKPVNQTITDDELGHKIVVKTLVRNFPAPSLPNAKDKEVVLVEVQVTTARPI